MACTPSSKPQPSKSALYTTQESMHGAAPTCPSQLHFSCQNFTQIRVFGGERCRLTPSWFVLQQPSTIYLDGIVKFKGKYQENCRQTFSFKTKSCNAKARKHNREKLSRNAAEASKVGRFSRWRSVTWLARSLSLGKFWEAGLRSVGNHVIYEGKTL